MSFITFSTSSNGTFSIRDTYRGVMTSILPDCRSMPIKYSMFFLRPPKLLEKVGIVCPFSALMTSKLSLSSSPYLPSFASKITLGSITSTVCQALSGI